MSDDERVASRGTGAARPPGEIGLEDRLLGAFRGVFQALHVGRLDGWPSEKLTMPQLKVLILAARANAAAHGCGGRPGFASGAPSRTVGSLAAHLKLSAPTVTGIVDRLEEAGLVERRRDKSDRRVVEVVATERGRRLVSEVFAAREERLRGFFAAMEEEDARALLRGLEAFREAIIRQGEAAIRQGKGEGNL